MKLLLVKREAMKTGWASAKRKLAQKSFGRKTFRLDIFLTDLAERFGITKVIIVCALYIFLKNGSLEQHREFVDKFILLKTGPGDNKYVFYIIIAVIIAFIDQRVSLINRIRLKEERIRELEYQIKMFENK